MTTPDMFTELTHPENVSKKDEFLYTSLRPYSVQHGVGGVRVYFIETKYQAKVFGILYGRDGENGWYLDKDQAEKIAHVICGFLNGEAA
jgi:hypothetical protein